jgi:hypothetical protein
MRDWLTALARFHRPSQRPREDLFALGPSQESSLHPQIQEQIDARVDQCVFCESILFACT